MDHEEEFLAFLQYPVQAYVNTAVSLTLSYCTKEPLNNPNGLPAFRQCRDHQARLRRHAVSDFTISYAHFCPEQRKTRGGLPDPEQYRLDLQLAPEPPGPGTWTFDGWSLRLGTGIGAKAGWLQQH